jgi:putative transposase
MLKTYKYRLYPTKSQISKLENTFSICRALYNYALEHRIGEYQRKGRNVSYYEQSASLPEIKKEFPWYKSVNAVVLQNVLKRLDTAYHNFFRRMKNNNIKSNEKGYPKFKKRGQWNSILYSDKNKIKYPTDKLIVPSIGEIKIILHRPINGTIKNMSIIKEANNWYVSFSVELNTITTELNVNTSKAIGIDVGLIDYYYDSNGNSLKAPRLLRIAEKNLKRLQRKLSKCKKQSKEFYSTLKALKTRDSKVKYKRLDFLYKTAYKLFSNNDLIVREDLNLKNLIKRAKPKLSDDVKTYLKNNASAKSGLNKSFSDASFGRFFNILDEVSIKLGKIVVKVNPSYTSQDCSGCGNRIKKSLSTRTHICNKCGLTLNRDLNASINILRLGLQSLGLNP